MEVKSGSQAIALADVQGLMLWALLGSNAASCPRWAFVKVQAFVPARTHTRTYNDRYLFQGDGRTMQ